jgi:hypothetical protein
MESGFNKKTGCIKQNADHESYKTDNGTGTDVEKVVWALPEGVDSSESWNTLASPARTVSSTNHGRPESAATNDMISLGELNKSDGRNLP